MCLPIWRPLRHARSPTGTPQAQSASTSTSHLVSDTHRLLLVYSKVLEAGRFPTLNRGALKLVDKCGDWLDRVPSFLGWYPHHPACLPVDQWPVNRAAPWMDAGKSVGRCTPEVSTARDP